MKLKTNWLKGLSAQDQEDLRASILVAYPAFERLIKLIEERQSTTDLKRRARSTYFMPAWKSYQADCNGYLRALEEIKQLINPDQGSKDD